MINSKTKKRKKKNLPVEPQKKTQRIESWFGTHKAAFHNAMQRFTSDPMATLLTILVVGVALSLPAIFQVVVKNLELGQRSIDQQSRISLFLDKNTSKQDVIQLLNEMALDQRIRNTHHIPPEQGLKDFKRLGTLGNTLDLFDDNPLPDVIQVFPDTQQLTPTQIADLSQELAQYDLVDLAQIDVLWLERLASVTQFVKQITLATSLFFIFIVLVIIGNTIKLLAQDFYDEIVVSKLVGATDSYVRRPFLYSGLLYGASGGVFAVIFVLAGILWIAPQVNRLAQLYDSQVTFISLNFSDVLTVISTGIVLGLGGAWIATNRLIHRLSL